MANDMEPAQDSAAIRELRTELDPELLRGVSLSECLSGWAQHFVPPDPGMFNVDKQKYQLSKPTEAYDEFISHDWATSRWLKFMSLLIIHNSRAAAVVTFLASVVVGVLQAFEVLPPDIWMILPLYALFWIVLFFWQRVRSIWLSPATVFLDKLCIAQHDEDLKLKGILGLAGFLDRSRQLTILWSHRYFSRMWCAYELATFLRDSQQQKPIHIMPVKMGVVIFLFAASEALVMIGFFMMSDLEFRGETIFEQLFWFWLSLSPLILLIVPITFYIGMSLMEDLQELPNQLANFSVKDAKCFCCSNDHRHPETGQTLPCDRELIFNMLRRWYGKQEDVGTEHLDRFDLQVQQGLAPTVLKSMGRSWIPLSYTIYMVGVSTVPGLSRTILVWKEGPPVELDEFGRVVWSLRELMKWAFIALVGVFWVQLSMRFLHSGLRLSKYISRLGCALVMWIPVMAGVSFEYSSFLIVLHYTPHDSLLPVVPFVVWAVFVVCLSTRSNGPAQAVQSARPETSERVFQEDEPEVVVTHDQHSADEQELGLKFVDDDASNADTISVFET